MAHFDEEVGAIGYRAFMCLQFSQRFLGKCYLPCQSRNEAQAAVDLMVALLEVAKLTFTERQLVELVYGLADGTLHDLKSVSKTLRTTEELAKQAIEVAIEKILRATQLPAASTPVVAVPSHAVVSQ